MSTYGYTRVNLGFLKMPSSGLKPKEVGDFALGCVFLSLICGFVVLCFPQVRWLRGVAGSLGFNAGCWGGGVAFWFSVRLGDRRLTFPNDLTESTLLQLAISQVQEFTADTFFSQAALVS